MYIGTLVSPRILITVVCVTIFPMLSEVQPDANSKNVDANSKNVVFVQNYVGCL